MKGILSFLEKAGLVTTDAPPLEQAPVLDLGTTSAAPAPANTSTAANVASMAPSPSPAAAPPAQSEGAPPRLDDIYASQGVSPSAYPAERLLRLLGGLSAMDEATRQLAIRAMDAADESWTIADPLADASAKVTALAAHAGQLEAGLEQIELDIQTQLDAVSARQAQVVGEIQKQMAELEALLARETARAAQETAAHEATLKAARERTARELETITQASEQLQGLSKQFGAPPTSTAKE